MDKVFGRLTIIHKTSLRNNKEIVWECICVCENTIFVKSGSLISGNTKSCGCLQKEIAAQRFKLGKGVSSFNALYSSYKRRAKSKYKSFHLTKDEFKILTKGKCKYCGIEPNQTLKQHSYNGTYIYNGIDRVDSNIGYTLDNCVPCCKICNRAKSNLTEKDWNEWVERIINVN